MADSKSRAQELSNDVSFVISGHQTWDLEGGGSNPPSISWVSITPTEIGLIRLFSTNNVITASNSHKIAKMFCYYSTVLWVPLYV